MDECDLDSPTVCIDESSEDEESESSDSTADDGTESEDEESEDESADQTYYAIESNSDTGSTSGGTAPIESGSELEEEGSCVGPCCHGGSFVEDCVGQPCVEPIDYDYESKATPIDPKSPYYSEIHK